MDTFETDAAALAALPASAVPAAFDRGHLISPRREVAAYALDPAIRFDYRPGLDFEPLSEAPQPMAERLFWWRNAASTPVDDYLGLRVGDAVMVQLPGEAIAGTVVETKRSGARVVCPWLAGTPNETNLEVTVHSRNVDGAWYGSY